MIWIRVKLSMKNKKITGYERINTKLSFPVIVYLAISLFMSGLGALTLLQGVLDAMGVRSSDWIDLIAVLFMSLVIFLHTWVFVEVIKASLKE